MSKKNNVVIPVKKNGKVSSYSISMDFSGNSREEISKSSSQDENPIGKNSTYLSPPIKPAIVARFFEQNPYHFRAIMFKAICIAGVGYDILPVDTAKENYFDDPEYIKLKNFIDNPNSEGEVFEDIMTSWYAERFNFGYGFLESVLSVKGELAEIYNLRAINAFAKLYYNNLFYIQKNYQTKDVWFRPFGSEVSAPAAAKQDTINDVLILKNYNLRTKYYGFAEWYSATPDLILDRSVIECRIREFDNNLMIQFMIICEGGEIDSEGLSQIKKFLASNYKGVENAGKVLYLNSDNPDVKIRIERLDKDIKEVSYITTREQNRDFILAAHGVAAILLGAKTKGQLGGTTEIKDLFKIFNETIVKPEKRTLKAKLKLLFTKLGITKFYLEPKELTIDTLKEMVEYVTQMKTADIIDKNEARTEFGYDPVEEDSNPDETVSKIYELAREVKSLRKQVA
jgi:HK97 family phage portal protein